VDPETVYEVPVGMNEFAVTTAAIGWLAVFTLAAERES
jgi:hypothetical protein